MFLSDVFFSCWKRERMFKKWRRVISNRFLVLGSIFVDVCCQIGDEQHKRNRKSTRYIFVSGVVCRFRKKVVFVESFLLRGVAANDIEKTLFLSPPTLYGETPCGRSVKIRRRNSCTVEIKGAIVKSDK